jgi:hypothetical protein
MQKVALTHGMCTIHPTMHCACAAGSQMRRMLIDGRTRSGTLLDSQGRVMNWGRYYRGFGAHIESVGADLHGRIAVGHVRHADHTSDQRLLVRKCDKSVEIEVRISSARVPEQVACVLGLLDELSLVQPGS